MSEPVTYFLFSKTRDAWKIGRSSHLHRRVYSLRGKTKDAALHSAFRHRDIRERDCHLRFTSLAIGGEWFRNDPGIRRFLMENESRRIFSTENFTPSRIAEHIRISMKQVAVCLEDQDHAALKREAKANRRTMGQQLLARALGIGEDSRKLKTKGRKP